LPASLHDVFNGGEKVEGRAGEAVYSRYANGEQPPPIQYPGPPETSAVGYMFRRLRLRW
jgi:hypothetical protein